MNKIGLSKKAAFIICVVILATSAIGKKAIINKLQIYLRKEPINLKNPLDSLDENRLGKYKVIKKTKIENNDIVEELGTTDYIIWELENTSLEDKDSTKYCSLFITYYTGINDRIPHVPEECYFGAGNRVKAMLDNSIEVEYKNIKNDINYRQLVFTSKAEDIWGTGTEFSVCYLLKVNGKYAGNRTAARNIMASNLFGKYSYFSKFEWRFHGKYNLPDQEKVANASKDLLETVLPILEEDHWPDIVNN
ncbi:MAG: hypothetical protein ACIAQZ_07140 [Sedimentisphaeraceae bacterium JB056]